jgi:hypothetical protein
MTTPSLILTETRTVILVPQRTRSHAASPDLAAPRRQVGSVAAGSIRQTPRLAAWCELTRLASVGEAAWRRSICLYTSDRRIRTRPRARERGVTAPLPHQGRAGREHYAGVERTSAFLEVCRQNLQATLHSAARAAMGSLLQLIREPPDDQITTEAQRRSSVM